MADFGIKKSSQEPYAVNRPARHITPCKRSPPYRSHIRKRLGRGVCVRAAGYVSRHDKSGGTMSCALDNMHQGQKRAAGGGIKCQFVKSSGQLYPIAHVIRPGECRHLSCRSDRALNHCAALRRAGGDNQPCNATRQPGTLSPDPVIYAADAVQWLCHQDPPHFHRHHAITFDVHE